MLVLQRRFGESLKFILPDGRDVLVVFREPTDVQGRADVQVLIDAPKDVKVWRTELLRENRA